MSEAQIIPSVQSRLITAAVGGAAGGALWALVDIGPEHVSNLHLLASLFVLLGSFFAVMLALIGPAGAKSAAMGAAVLALPLTVLFALAGLNFAPETRFWEQGFAIWAVLVTLLVGTPFLAAFFKSRAAWNNYAVLFDQAWTIVVRFTAAWLFAGLFWLVLFLAGALLKLVGLPLIEMLLEIDPVPFVLHGVVLGLALAVVHELRDYVSPFLVLRLLRLLLPLVLVVIGLFILALPFRGVTGLFGSFSAAVTLLGMAAGAITLITAALDQSDAHAVSARWMRLMVQTLALTLPIITGLAVYAIYVRVAQYGWTPDRLYAATLALIIFVYACLYAAAVARRQGWMRRIRQTNIWMALGVLGVMALWLSPLLNAEAISTKSQLSRFVAGRTKAADLPIWALTREWGRAGQAGVDRLRAMKDVVGYELMLRQITQAESSKHEFDFRKGASETGNSQNMSTLAGLLPVLGGDGGPPSRIDADMFADWGDWRLQRWLKACQRVLPSGQPGCALVWTHSWAAGPVQARGLAFLLIADDDVEVMSVVQKNDRLQMAAAIERQADGQDLHMDGADLMAVLAGDFRLAPSSRQALWLGNLELIPNN